MRQTSLVILSVACLFAGGCSQGPTEPAAKFQPLAAETEATPLDPATTRAIATASESFLRAILSGDSASAARLLTAKAAERHAADPNVLTPMGMQVERLDLGEIRLLSPAEAAAQCFVSETGAPQPHELCCLLKLETSGWRVCGLACDADSDSPAVMSFEEDLKATAPTQFVDQSGVASEVPRTAAGPTSGEIR